MDFGHSEDNTGRKPISDKTMTGDELTKMLQEAGVIPTDGITDTHTIIDADYHGHTDERDDINSGASLIIAVCVAAILSLVGFYAIWSAFA